MRCLATICIGGLVARIRCMRADNTRLGVGLVLACLSCAENMDGGAIPHVSASRSWRPPFEAMWYLAASSRSHGQDGPGDVGRGVAQTSCSIMMHVARQRDNRRLEAISNIFCRRLSVSRQPLTPPRSSCPPRHELIFRLSLEALGTPAGWPRRAQYDGDGD